VELKAILRQIEEQTISKCFNDGRLEVVPTGSGAPCLDLLRISEEVSSACQGVDLVMIEGMGRAIQYTLLTSTNFYAQFKVDSVKIAVFKNPQIAQELNANMYDGLLLFEPIK
jgi:bifunctional damage-control phosphatase, subfamily II, fusion protein